MNCQGMFLESPSGYMVPFLLEREDDVTEIMLPYGDQVHPRTGERFFHHGVDFVCDHLPLFAVASGLVVGAGNDGERGDFIVTRYGRYQVRYCHISEAKAAYGARVTAGQEIAVSGDFLHIDVRYDGDELNPEDFLKMLFSNVSMLTALDADSFPEALSPDIPVETDYDDCREEIEALMQLRRHRRRCLPSLGEYRGHPPPAPGEGCRARLFLQGHPLADEPPRFGCRRRRRRGTRAERPHRGLPRLACLAPWRLCAVVG